MKCLLPPVCVCVPLLSSRVGQMSCFSQSLRRTSPAHSGGRNELVFSKPPRVNGWSWPPQVFQVMAWLLYAYLAVVGFGVYIPLLPLPWSHVLYAVSLVTPIPRLSDWKYEGNVCLSCSWTRQGSCCVQVGPQPCTNCVCLLYEQREASSFVASVTCRTPRLRSAAHCAEIREKRPQNKRLHRGFLKSSPRSQPWPSWCTFSATWLL